MKMDSEAGAGSVTRRSSLGHVPSGPWKFDDHVTAVFEDMLQRSIPQYEVMRDTIHLLAREFVRPGALVVDLGSSSGAGIGRLVQEEVALARNPAAHFVAVECSRPMLEVLRARFGSGPERDLVTVVDHDLRHGLPALGGQASLVLSVLTLQFVPMEYRQQVLRSAYDALADGGALILVEKILGESAALDEVFVRHYLQLKMGNGYSIEEVERKRLSLEGILVPVTAAWNEDMCQRAGFSEVDCFWRWLNFAGWIALKT